MPIQVNQGRRVNLMRVTVGQINTTNGDYEGNSARILRAIEQARHDRSDLLVLPEVSAIGMSERIARSSFATRADVFSSLVESSGCE